MVKKIGIGIAIVAVIAAVLFFVVPWGEYESKIDKSAVNQAVEKDSTGNVIPSLSLIEGVFVAASKDSSNAEILFDVDGLKKTKGAFESFTIQFDIKPDYTQSELTVSIASNSINTNNGMRDEHLLDADFFDAATYPEILFNAATIAISDTGYVTKGELTLLDATKPIDVPFKHLGNGKNDDGVAFEAFEGNVVFDRTAYGMEEVSGAGNVVTLSFYCELVAQ